MRKEYVLDGSKITSREAFYDEVCRVLIPDQQWGRNLDAFNDILRGGFGTPEEGFTLKWSRSALSKEKLGSELFNTLIGIIKDHGEGGEQAEDNVRLVLE